MRARALAAAAMALLVSAGASGAEVVERGIVDGFPVDVAVSSMLVQEGEPQTKFRPVNVLDGEHASVWMHEGEGTGAWLELRFPAAVRMLGVEIYPGDAAANGIDAFEVRVDGEPVRNEGFATLASMSRWTYFVPFGGMRSAERVRMTVQKTYRETGRERGCVGTFRPVFADVGGTPLGRTPIASTLRFATATGEDVARYLADGEVELTHELALDDGTIVSASEVEAEAAALSIDERWETVVVAAQQILRLALAGRELVAASELGDKTRIVSVSIDDRALGRERLAVHYELGARGWRIRRLIRTELRQGVP